MASTSCAERTAPHRFSDWPRPGASVAVLCAILVACSSDGRAPAAVDAADLDAASPERDATVDGPAVLPDSSERDVVPPPNDALPDVWTTRVTPAPEGEPWDTLEQWHLFSDAAAQVPADRVVPYTVNASLFADYAAKHRFLYVPEGERIGYESTKKWRFPVGTILVKTFSYYADTRDPSQGERLLETRLLIRETDDWATHTYVWNDEQTAARRKIAGDILDVDFIDPSGNAVENRYLVPNENECRSCHGKTGETDTLGGRTRQLDRNHDYGDGPVNQIDHFAALGLLDVAPDPIARRQRLVDPFGSAPLFERVRAYFDGNCAHCHQPGDSQGSLSGLWLDYESTDPETRPAANWGICKQPQSAGGATCARRVDVVPGQPDQSILICRMESTEPDVRMAPVGRTLAHAEGVALMREWILSLQGSCGAKPADAGADDGGGDGGDAAPPAGDAGPGDSGND